MALAEVMGAEGNPRFCWKARAEYRLVPVARGAQAANQGQARWHRVAVPEAELGEEALAFVAAGRWAVEQLARARRLATLRRPEAISWAGALPGESRCPSSDPIRGVASTEPGALGGWTISITCAPGQVDVARPFAGELAPQAGTRSHRAARTWSPSASSDSTDASMDGPAHKRWATRQLNWRLIMAPVRLHRDPRVHLAVPDHSPRFWLGRCRVFVLRRSAPDSGWSPMLTG